MSNEQIKERIANKRENYKLLAIVMLAIATGIVTNIYQIVVHKAPTFTFIFSIVGFIINLQLAIIMKNIANQIEELIKELT